MEKFTNEQALTEFTDMGISLRNLFWIGPNIAGDDDGEFYDVIQDFQSEVFCQLFGINQDNVKRGQHFYDKEEAFDLLIKYKKFGFFAELGKNECKNFSYNKAGQPVGWSSSAGIQSIFYAYGETPEELFDAIRKCNEQMFQSMMLRDKEKEAPNV